MSFWKKLKGKAEIVLGTAALAICGAGAYWAYEVRGFEVNVTRVASPLERAVFVGDTGENRVERVRLIEGIRGFNPQFVFLLGDLGYPTGISGPQDFAENINPFLNSLWTTVCILGNHDSLSLNREERNWMAANSDTYGCSFKNYYRAFTFPNACVISMDSTVYSVAKEPGILSNQEKFIRKAVKLCERKTTYLLAHHNRVGFSNHRSDISWDYKGFLDSLPAQVTVIHGHEHLAASYIKNGKQYYTFGSGSKKSPCKHPPESGTCVSKFGFGALENGRIIFKQTE